MSYGSIDGGAFGGRIPFGGPASQGYQPVGKNLHLGLLVHPMWKYITSGFLFLPLMCC